MGVVDDVDGGFDGGLCVNAGACCVAAQRKNCADLDGFFLGRSIARENNGKREGAKQPQDMLDSHVDRLRKYQIPGSEGPLGGSFPPPPPSFKASDHCMPVWRGQVAALCTMPRRVDGWSSSA